MFSEKHVRLFSETRTRIYENTYVFFEKDVHVFPETRTCFSKNSYVFFERHNVTTSNTGSADKSWG